MLCSARDDEGEGMERVKVLRAKDIAEEGVVVCDQRGLEGGLRLLVVGEWRDGVIGGD